MPTLTLKNIPEAVYKRLKYFARLHHRSLNSEIIFNLEKSVGLAMEDPEDVRRDAESLRERTGRKFKVSGEDMDKAIHSGR